MADVDLGRLRQERMRVNTFGDCIQLEAGRLTAWRSIGFRLDAPDAPVALQRTIERFPFVPSDPAKLSGVLLAGFAALYFVVRETSVGH